MKLTASQVAEPAAVPFAPASTPTAVQVKTVDHATAQAAGVDGLMVGLTRSDDSGAPGKASVSLDYSAVMQAYGGGWASRLHLVQLPACAQTTPQLAQCQTQTPLATTNDPAAHQLTATVALPASAPSRAGGVRAMSTMAAPMAATASSTTVAAVSGTGGSQGSYGATSLSASGTWGSSASGAFTYDYPIQVPTSLGGAAPTVGLSYSSQAVDGETSARNSQASWIGDGWDYSPGFIERQYKSCANDGIAGSGDECWAGWNATISLGAYNGQLVRDVNGQYHLQGDDGTKVEYLTGASNGLWNGEYWKITATDGTQYYLGLNHAPGTTADPATNSGWGVPIYSPKAGDPCYDSSKGNASQCANMGYRFNLDFVVDPSGNVQRFDWANETNWYNKGAGQANGAGGALTAYTRGGYLTQISYGYQLSDERAGREPADKITFVPAQRCTTDPTTCQVSNLNSTTAPNWPDTPYDLNCTSSMATSGTGSNVCQTSSPTFWSTYRLQSIKTSVKAASGWQDVDSWALTHLFSDTGGTVDPITGKTVDPKDAGSLQSVMWLSQIQHTGLDTSAGGSGNVALDPVTFTGVEMDNRVDGLTPAASPLYRPRLSSLQTETGESIAVTYRAPECSRVANSMPTSPDSDTMACYNVYWTTPGAANPISDWFQKTLVAQVSDNDATKAASPARVTNYTYSGGAAWHRDDSDLTDDQYRTWNQFRGYRTVTTTTGAAPDPVTQNVVNYFQGMDGDYKADGTKRSVSLTNNLGESVTDSPWLAGNPQETDAYTQAGGTVLARTLAGVPTMTVTASTPRTAWTSKSPAPPALSTLPPLNAQRAQSVSSRSQQLLANGTWRTSQATVGYDSVGRVAQVDNKGDVSVPAQEMCTSTSYANAPASNPMMLSYPAETIAVTGPCGTAPSGSTTVSDKRTFYDGDGSVTNPGTLGQIGGNGSTLGLITSSQAVTSYDASNHPVFQTLGAATFDQYGRATKLTDAAGQTSTTSYTPATATVPTALSTTNPLGWTATSSLAPGRGVVTHAADVNGRVTDTTYDALGRRTATWQPGRDKATQSADKLFSYAVSGVGTPNPTAVTTQTLREDGSYGVAVDIYDGFLQLRQTQASTADNSTGRLISSTHYDSHGWVHSSVAAFADPTMAPGPTLFSEQENTLPSETLTGYDGLGRVTSTTLENKSVALWSSTTAYPGADKTDSTPAQGGVPTSTFANALGQTTSTVAHGGAGIGDVTTSYTYTSSGNVATVKDTAGNTWSYKYDLQGRKVSQTDPDAGTSTTTFDPLGRVATSTDGRGQSLSFTYDQLSRPIGEFAGTSTSDATKQLTSYTYDTLAKGYPTSSTRYVGGASGSAYVQAVTGYNTAYQPTGSSVTIPASEGALAGTYALGSDYTANIGLLAHTNYPAGGGLAAESVGYGYDNAGLRVSSGSGRSTRYLNSVAYTPLGQTLQSTYGNPTTQFRTAQTWDDATRRLTLNSVSIQTAPNPISATTLGYDQAGNIATTRELQSTGGTDQAFDTQCFQYDGLDRLATAWTDTAGQTGATPGQLAKCSTAGPAPATLGGPAPYWQSFSYNLLGDRTRQVKHDLTGNAAKDITQTLAYPTNGTQPNTLSSATTTGPGGTTTQAPTYDPAGNTTGRTTTGATAANQSFTYDAEGRTATVTTTAGVSNPLTTGYLYDASGGLLLQRGPNSTVLYLFGGAEQLTLTGSTVSGLRYYPNPDGTVIVRSSSGTVTYQPTNIQGTAQLQVDYSTLAITRRSFDPYGSPRGVVPPSWADNHGYLGKPTDSTTGLNLLGARQYDPTLGRFLTADPVFEAGDPNQMGGYTYAGNNPSTHSDPSGLLSDSQGADGFGLGSVIAFPTSVGGGHPLKKLAGMADSVLGTLALVDPRNVINMNIGILNSVTGLQIPKINAPDYDHITADAFGINPNDSYYQQGYDTGTMIQVGLAAIDAGEFGAKAVTALPKLAEKLKSLSGLSDLAKGDAPLVTDPLAKPTTPTTSDTPSAASPDTGSGGNAGGPTGGGGTDHPSGGGGTDHPTGGGSSDHPSGGGDGGSGPSGSSSSPCSFAPETPVLLGDGSTKPIGDIKPGDEVKTADPTSGDLKGSEPVTATAVKLDKNLVDLVVITDDGAQPTIHTTDNHPFYDATVHAWIPAGSLPAGDLLATTDGRTIRVGEVGVTPGEANRYNLTVAEYHTYYVL
ncbi:hypothetical protein C7C46_08050, partial [Streptomyces tateyamensis]